VFFHNIFLFQALLHVIHTECFYVQYHTFRIKIQRREKWPDVILYPAQPLAIKGIVFNGKKVEVFHDIYNYIGPTIQVFQARN